MWLLLTGCHPPLDAFADARAEAICARHDRCGTLAAAGFPDLAACDEALLGAAAKSSRACGTYDTRAAEVCLAAWEEPCDAPPELAVCDRVCR